MSKYDDDEVDAKTALAETPEVIVARLDAGPSNCAIDRELKLGMTFTVSAPIRQATWEVMYVVDSTHKRLIIILGHTDKEAYGTGEHTMSFQVPKVDVSGIKPSKLTNVGLLTARLTGVFGESDEPRHVIDVNLVVQVTQEGDAFNRVIFNPLD